MKSIMVSDQTYEKLASIKAGKSFTELLSELVDSLKKTRVRDILKFAGIMDASEAKVLNAEVAKIRNGFGARR
jgi:predicted CopG family antitoxin